MLKVRQPTMFSTELEFVTEQEECQENFTTKSFENVICVQKYQGKIGMKPSSAAPWPNG